MCVQCVVIVDFRVSAVYLDQLDPVEKFILLCAKLALQNRHFVAQNALELTDRHLGFKIFPGVIPQTPF